MHELFNLIVYISVMIYKVPMQVQVQVVTMIWTLNVGARKTLTRITKQEGQDGPKSIT